MLVEMADEDEDFVTIGTAFDIPEQDEQPRKRFEKHEQFAVDSKGRRRFHGAFTGGFSAGYFNSVGTKEGWSPSTFVSSRSNRAAKETGVQKPEDFMDEEDLGEHGIAPKIFMTKDNFTPADKEIRERKRVVLQAVQEGAVRSAVPGGIPVDDLIIPSKLSIGVQLLRKMGWKEGQGIGGKAKDLAEAAPIPPSETKSRKVYGCSFPISTQVETDIDNLEQFLAPKDVQPIDFKPKDNIHGIGYRGIDPTSTMFIGRSSYQTFKPTDEVKRGIRGQAFGVGAFEEDDENVYGTQDMSDYDFSLSSEREGRLASMEWTGPPKKDKLKGAVAGFHKASRATAINKIFRPPRLPENYTPKKSVDNATPSLANTGQAPCMNANLRAVLLGEKVSKKSSGSVNNKAIGENEQNAKELEKESITAGFGSLSTIRKSGEIMPEVPKRPSRWDKNFKTSISYAGARDLPKEDSFKPFPNDPEKQQRYESFVASRKLGKETELIYDKDMTEWEKDREMEEFARASILFRPMSTSMSSRFTRASQSLESKETEKRNETDENEKLDCERAAKLGFFGKLTRQTFDWFPSSVLCKRLNIPNPYPGSRFTGTLGREKRKAKDWLPLLDIPITGHDSGIKNDPPIASSEIKEKHYQSEVSFKQVKSHDSVTSVQINENLIQSEQDDSRVINLKDGSKQLGMKVGPLSYLNHLDETKEDSKSVSSDIKSSDKEDETLSNRPPLDLFKSIFSDSDNSSQDEAESNDLEMEFVKNEMEVDLTKRIPDSSKKGIMSGNEMESIALSESTNNGGRGENIVEEKSKLRATNEEEIDTRIPQRNQTNDKETEGIIFGPSLPHVQKARNETPHSAKTVKSSEVSVMSNPNKADLQIERSVDGRQKEIKEKIDKIYSKALKKAKKKYKKSKAKKHKRKKDKVQKALKVDEDSSEWSSSAESDFETLKTADRKELNSRQEKGLSKNESDRHRSNRREKYEKLDRKSRKDVSSQEGTSKKLSTDIPGDHDRGKEESSPSAREIFKKLKKQGISLKRMSAADFM